MINVRVSQIHDDVFSGATILVWWSTFLHSLPRGACRRLLSSVPASLKPASHPLFRAACRLVGAQARQPREPQLLSALNAANTCYPD
jgi:hypothetical protein